MTLLFGYVGPGAGLGLLGSLMAIVAVIAVGLLGLVLYPLKLAVTWFRARSAVDSNAESISPSRTGVLTSLAGTQERFSPSGCRS